MSFFLRCRDWCHIVPFGRVAARVRAVCTRTANEMATEGRAPDTRRVGLTQQRIAKLDLLRSTRARQEFAEFVVASLTGQLAAEKPEECQETSAAEEKAAAGRSAGACGPSASAGAD